MRSLTLFVAGILLGLAVQTGIAQTDRVINVNHVGITVSNFDEAMKFFKESMGFREAFTVRDEKTGPKGSEGKAPKGTPGKAVRPTGRTCSTARGGHLGGWVGRLGRPQSPTKGKPDGIPPPVGR